MAQRLSPAQFHTLFNILDEDDSGEIDAEELATFFLNIGIAGFIKDVKKEDLI